MTVTTELRVCFESYMAYLSFFSLGVMNCILQTSNNGVWFDLQTSSHAHQPHRDSIWLKSSCSALTKESYDEALCQPSSAKLLLAISHVLQVFLFPFPCSRLPLCTFTKEHYSTSYFNSLGPVLPICLEVKRHLLQPSQMCSVNSRL